MNYVPTIKKDEILGVSRDIYSNAPDMVKVICAERHVLMMPLEKIMWHKNSAEQFCISIIDDGYFISGPREDLEQFLQAINFEAPIF